MFEGTIRYNRGEERSDEAAEQLHPAARLLQIKARSYLSGSLDVSVFGSEHMNNETARHRLQ